MGWLWSSATSAPSSTQPIPPSTASPAQKDEVKPPPPPAAPEEAPSKPLSPEELAEQELQSFLQELDADTHTSSKKYSSIGRKPPPTTPSRPLSELPISEQLLPTAMSCREAFDAAFYCNSFGGKFNDIYRYGTVQPCSQHWDKFWFCMRTRTWPSPQKDEAIRDYYRKVERRKYAEASSEDVWQSREQKVPEGSVWRERMEFPNISDEEWNRMDRERREVIRKVVETRNR